MGKRLKKGYVHIARCAGISLFLYKENNINSKNNIIKKSC